MLTPIPPDAFIPGDEREILRLLLLMENEISRLEVAWRNARGKRRVTLLEECADLRIRRTELRVIAERLVGIS